MLETEAKLFIQSKIKQGLYSLVWSFILDSENDENPSEERREVITPWRLIAKEYCAASEDILKSGRQYMKIGLKHKDALHLACAIQHGCNYLITTDRKFHSKNKLVNGIEIINPVAFLLETEETR